MTRIPRPFLYVLLTLAALPLVPGVLWLVGMYAVLHGPFYDEVKADWNQRLTITVETPLGTRSGAAVQHIAWAGPSTKDEGKPLGDGAHSSWTVTGEAAVVEVAPGKYLFALLKPPMGFVGEPGKNLAYALLQMKGLKGYVSSEASIKLIKALPLDQPVTVPEKAWPLMVTFADITDPKSVQRVDPDDLAASFGPGVSLKAVTLAMTEEPVTEGKVEAVLGDLAKMGRQLDPATRIQYPADFPEADIPSDAKYFDVSSFKTGLYK